MIYICIPSHDEERTVGVLLWKIRQVMASFPRDYEILVLDDASTDATQKVVAPYARVLPLTIARNEKRLGYARSVERLLREAVRRSGYPKRDMAIVLQADFTHDPAEIPALVKRIEAGADIVIGADTAPRPELPKPLRWARRILGFLLRRARWPEGVSDPLTGYRAYRIQVLRRAFDEAGERALLRREGWTADVELLRKTVPHSRRVAQAEVRIRHDRRQRPSRFDAWATSRDIVRYMWLHRGDAALATSGEPDDTELAVLTPVEAPRAGRGAGGREERFGNREEHGRGRSEEHATRGRGARQAGRGRAEREGGRDGSSRTASRSESSGRGRSGQTGGSRPRRGGAGGAAGADSLSTSPEPAPTSAETAGATAGAGGTGAAEGDAAAAETKPPRRKRRSRGGRSRSGRSTGTADVTEATSGSSDSGPNGDAEAGSDPTETGAGDGTGDNGEGAGPGSRPKARRSRRGRRRGTGARNSSADAGSNTEPGDGGSESGAGAGAESAGEPGGESGEGAARKPRRRRRSSARGGRSRREGAPEGDAGTGRAEAPPGDDASG